MEEHANSELRKAEIYVLWVASETSLPAANSKLIMLLPTSIVKVCAKYQFLDEIYELCSSLCVQKPGTAGVYVYVTRNSTKSSLEDFSWSSLFKK